MVDEGHAAIHAIIQGLFYVTLIGFMPWYLGRWLMNKNQSPGFVILSFVMIIIANFFVFFLVIITYVELVPIYSSVVQRMVWPAFIGIIVGLASILLHRSKLKRQK